MSQEEPSISGGFFVFLDPPLNLWRGLCSLWAWKISVFDWPAAISSQMKLSLKKQVFGNLLLKKVSLTSVLWVLIYREEVYVYPC